MTYTFAHKRVHMQRIYTFTTALIKSYIFTGFRQSTTHAL